MKNRAVWIGLAIGAVIIGRGLYYLYGDQEFTGAKPVAQWPSDKDTLPPPELASEDPPIQHPVPVPSPAQGAESLPELEDSDDKVMSELRELYGPQTLDAVFVPRDVIRRLVLVIDSLDRDPLPLWLRPVRTVPGNVAVDKNGDALALNPDNAQRYAPLVLAFASADTTRMVALYRRYYPLFQDAYDRIGNPRSRYFNDRLIQIIDHLLNTPVVAEPIALVRPKVRYQFADPELEERSSGQKTMLRIGRANADRVKAKLRELRAALVSQAPTG